VILTFFTSPIYISCSFINYKREKICDKFIFSLSNEEITKIKAIDLEKLYNFVVETFLI